MIRFQCNKCDRTIKVSDAYAGKRGKCPACGTSITVPGSDVEMALVGASTKTATAVQHVRFTCAMCDKPVKVSGRLVGKTIECPNCKCYLDVPDENAKKQQPKPASDDSLQLKAGQQTDPQNSLYDYLENHLIDRKPASNSTKGRIGASKLPPIIQILLYPISLSGLMTLAIFTFGPIVIDALALVCLFSCIGPFIILFIYLAWVSYMFWFFSYCVQQSSEGVPRAPQTIGVDEGFGEMFFQMLRILVCMIIFLLPATLYRYYVAQDTLYWIIFCAGMAFFPMALLSVTMHNSLCGLNPLLLVVSIIKTFPRYCIVAASAAVLILMMLATNLPKEQAPHIAVTLTLNGIYFYLALILANVLGRFYYISKDRLDWQV